MTYEDFGIEGIRLTGDEEQRTYCPKCLRRKGGRVTSKDLAVNTQLQTWQCFSSNCGWTGSLHEKRKVERPVFVPIKKELVPPTDKTFEWFEKRGITKSVIERNRITKDKVYIAEIGKEAECICFNYFVGEDLINIKYRDKDKHFSQVKDAAKIFYKLNDIENESECLICEGEIDSLSFEVAGFENAISVPDGAINPNAKNLISKLSYLDNCAEYFVDMQKIYLATDTDNPGIKLREELARRLGKRRCWIVRFPDGCKDANEVLVKFGKEELQNCVDRAEMYPVEGIHYAHERSDELMNIYENGYPSGAVVGWNNFNKKLKFFDSCFTVIVGVPSHGKSNFMDNLMVFLAVMNGWKFGVFSPENAKIEIHLERLCRILIGKNLTPFYNNRMSCEEKDEAMEFINKHFFWILPENENYTVQNILDAAAYLTLKEGIKSLVIDPWNCLEHNYGQDTETEYTKKTLNKLIYFEREHGLHLFLVVHPAKMRRKASSSQYEIPTLYDCSGSAQFYNKAEIGMTIWREFDRELNQTKYSAVFINKVKHNYMGETGTVKFDFDVKSQRFYEQGVTRYEGSFLDKNYLGLSREQEFWYNQEDDDDKPPF